MILTIDDRRQAFGYWLRTGRLPTACDADGVERKLNPWHDPADGRFTFAGAGRPYGYGNGKMPDRATLGRSVSVTDGDQSNARNSIERPTGARVRNNKWRQRSRTITRANRDQRNAVAEFALGSGEGVYQTAKKAAEGVYSALTTDPLTTARNIGRGVAATIDAAIAAEDTPAQVQIARAINAAKAASAHDLGKAVGTVVANTTLAFAPGAAATRISALRDARKIGARETIPPPEIRWLKETLTEGRAKAYNDSAPGARPGQAPALKLAMPDGSQRWVKFDGVAGEYLIDRKRSLYGSKRAREQGIRQSQSLRQNRTQATWEVPNEKQRRAALRFFERNNIKNIKVRIVEE